MIPDFLHRFLYFVFLYIYIYIYIFDEIEEHFFLAVTKKAETLNNCLFSYFVFFYNQKYIYKKRTKKKQKTNNKQVHLRKKSTFTKRFEKWKCH